MLELKPRPIESHSEGNVGRKQPRRLLLAFGLLLVALLAVIARDHDFWFGSDESSLDGDGSSAGMAQQAAQPVAPNTTTAASASQPVPATVPAVTDNAAKTTETASPVAVAKSARQPKPTEAQPAEAKPVETKSTTKAAEPGIVANRTVLPPLNVEVVAGDKHSTLQPDSNKLQITTSTPQTSTAVNAAEREKLPTAQPTPGVAEISYPVLAQHSNVQGSVVLQALISADGVIENLRVLSGPSILTAAAQQAVREWRFKPYLQNGQPVETKAKITVNFTIKVADTAPKSS